MKFVIASKDNIYAELDIIPCPFALMINKANILNPDLFSITESDSEETCKWKIEQFLDKRIYRECSHEYDAKALKLLNLETKKHMFGRMNDFYWAVGFITGFESENDDICMRPLYSELMTFAYFGPEWGNLYVLKGWK